MNLRSFFGALALGALIAAPSFAAADPYNGNGNNWNIAAGTRQITGIIQSVQGSSLTLEGGRTVFLHQGTVIRPTGLRLKAGMQVSVTGVRSGHLRFNADEVDVTRHRHN